MPKFRTVREGASEISGRKWVLVFLTLVFGFDLGLFFFGNSALRMPFRIGAFALSLLYLGILQAQKKVRRSTPTPASRFVLFAALILLIAFVNPSGDTILSRLAVSFVYLAVLAPLVWLGHLEIDQQTFRKVLIVLWCFYTMSAAFGVLQVEYPGQFDGAMTENIDEASLQSHIFTLADGRKIIRPKGLSDNPGGAATAGIYTIVLGTGLLLTEKKTLIRLASAAGMLAGLFCIYICQGRSNLVIVALAEVAMLLLLFKRGIMGKAVLFLVVGGGVAVLGTAMAFAVGGESTIDRWASLTDEDPSTVYQDNRGQFLSELITVDIFKYPLGAGEGRWGMMNLYFGGNQPPLWAEMQWQALLYDGGIPLVIIYIGLLASLLWTAYKIALSSSSDDIACWAAVIFGYTVSAAAATLSFPFLCHDLGIHLMLLNGCLFGASIYKDGGYTGERWPLKQSNRMRSSVGFDTRSATFRPVIR